MMKMNLRKKRNGKMIYIIAVLILLSFPANYISVEASNNESTFHVDNASEIKDTVVLAVKQMEPVLNKTYENVLSEIKEEIVKRDYDYNTTIEAMMVSGHPYSHINYADIMSAYIALKEDTSEIEGFASLPFLSYSITEMSRMENIPVKENTYAEIENGIYEKSGITFITENCEIDNYAVNTDGTYYKDGKKEIVCETEEIKYGHIEFDVLNGEKLMKLYGHASGDEVYTHYQTIYNRIKDSVMDTRLNQTTFIAVRENTEMPEEIKAYLSMLQEQYVGTNVGALMEAAFSLIGNVPYEWGGKSTMPGYDTSWWTFDSEGNQNGLDCSGYVQWCFRTAGFPDELWQSLLSTGDILANCMTINQAELDVGDLGLLNNGTSEFNHVGIYLGNGYWIHCNGSANTVSVNATEMFTLYRRVPNTIEGYNRINIDNYGTLVYNLSNDWKIKEIQAISRYVGSVGAEDGMNTWVALTEVIKNRLSSEEYPNTVTEILQDSTLFGISEPTIDNPSDTLIDVVTQTMDGNMSVLNNPSIVLARKSDGTSNDLGATKYIKTEGTVSFYAR